MKHAHIFPLYAALIATAMSCNMEDSLVSGGMEVNLSAGISYAPSKAGGPYNPDSQETLAIQMLRWDENSTTTGKSPIDATLGAPDANNGYLRGITFDTRQYFSNRTSLTGFIGWYPATSSGMKYTPQDRTLQYDINAGDTDVMISNFVSGSYESGIPSMEFSHALCQYSVAIYAVDETAKKQWEERFGDITDITLTGFPQNLVATLPETPNGTTDIRYEGTSAHYTVTESRTEMPVGIGNKATVGNIIMAAPATDDIVTITISFSQGTEKQIAMSREFLAGYRYSFTLRFSHNGLIEPESSINEWVETDTDLELDEGKTYYNLSQYGTANCYIVSSANASYCFDCTVKGNGVNSVTDHSGNTFALPDNNIGIAPDSIGIIRSSAVMKKQNGRFVLIPDNPDSDYNERTDTEMLTLDTDAPREGRVLFTVKGNTGDASDHALIYKGNVLIGAFSGETLLWSWHIWITDRPDTQGYGNGFSSLDRNLGAVTDNPSEVSDDALSTGFYYQWGRKDPLSRYDIDPDRNADGYSGFQSANTVSMTTAHRNPRVMYYSSEDGNDDWLSTPNNYLWGYANQRDDVQKTMYDPCPPGYRVPETKVWTISGQYTLVEDENGEGYKFNMDGNQTIYYPKTDYLGYNQGEGYVTLLTDQTGAGKPYIYLNSARPHICSDFTGEDGTVQGHEALAHHFIYTQGSDDIIPYEREQAGARANAMPVRCVSTNSTPATTDLSSIQTANSYVVSRNGYYKFLATRRGNGVSSFNTYDQSNNTTSFVDISAGLTPEIATNSGCRVDLLWWQGELRDRGDFLELVNDNPTSAEIERMVPVAMDDGGRLDSEGYAHFYLKDVNSYGNVGLALYDEQGTILWTWHIWILPTEVNVTVGDYVVMSRNLGATYTPYNDAGTFSLDDGRIEESYGLYYQWGRKDPLFGPGKWCRKASSGRWEVEDWTGRPDTAPATTVAASAGNPLVFYTSNDNFWQTTYTPGTTGSYEIRHFWGFVGVRGQQGDNFVKTMYDPCPPGYRVMNQASFTSANICSGDDQTSQTLYFNGKYNRNGIRIDKPGDVWSTYGGNSSVNGTSLWFPNNPFINDSGRYVNDGNGGSLHTATPFNNGNQKRYFYWDTGNDNTTYTVGQNNGEGHKSARPVRCQRE